VCVRREQAYVKKKKNKKAYVNNHLCVSVMAQSLVMAMTNNCYTAAKETRRRRRRRRRQYLTFPFEQEM
jgi:hypothetical protein